MHYFCCVIWNDGMNELSIMKTLTNINQNYVQFIFWLYFFWGFFFSVFLFFFFWFCFTSQHQNRKDFLLRTRFGWLLLLLLCVTLIVNAGVLSVFAFLLTSMEKRVLGKRCSFHSSVNFSFLFIFYIFFFFF